MAPLITTSLREYAIEQVRYYESHTGYIELPADVHRDEWLGLQDWTESPDTLHSFNEALTHLDTAFAMLYEAYETDNDTPFTRDLQYHIERARDAAEDARAVITNIRRKDMRA
jgi:uncharacterized circularly permuted ATP-grasp superfamily protein